MRLAFNSFWYNCDNGLDRWVRLWATLFEFRGNWSVVGSACWDSSMGTFPRGGRQEEVDIGFDMPEKREVGC